jgi:hypothetical protein
MYIAFLVCYNVSVKYIGYNYLLHTASKAVKLNLATICCILFNTACYYNALNLSYAYCSISSLALTPANVNDFNIGVIEV